MIRAFLNQTNAQALDLELMNCKLGGFSIDQLMELAGLSVACAIHAVYPQMKRILAIAGPGNNGGDALVAARHLFHFGHSPVVLYPKIPKTNEALFLNLKQQLVGLEIPFLNELPETYEKDFDLVLDGIFGFSFDSSQPIRAPFDKVLKELRNSKIKIASIDIPSGWDVEDGDGGFGLKQPDMLISLTAPKVCAKKFTGNYHYLGGRFLPPALKEKYNLQDLPSYKGSDQCVALESKSDAACL